MIKANEVVRKYGKSIAVDGISFAINQGEIVGLLGHNGAGKTTIMKMITGYLEPSAGSILIDGLDTFSERLRLQKHIGYLPENCPLYSEMSVADYLGYIAGLRGVPAERRLASVAWAIEKTGLTDVIQKQIGTLSRGYRQRVGVAQAIIHSPRIIILDEPTNGLDPSQILEMRALIKELAKSAIVVISTHILQEVKAVCDRAIVIHKGRVALDTEMSRLELSNQIAIAIDRAPADCQNVFDELKIKIIQHRIEPPHHIYSLEPSEESISRATSELVRALVRSDINLYSMQPIVRDLQAVFAELAANKPPNGSTTQPSGNGLQHSVGSSNTDEAES